MGTVKSTTRVWPSKAFTSSVLLPMARDVSTLKDLHVGIRPWRPPTAVYPDRQEIARSRAADYPATTGPLPRVYLLNLEGGFFAPGALKDLIVPLAQDIGAGKHGDVVLMVATSDDATVDFLEGIATQYALSFFILASPTAPLSEARPVGRITSAEAEALDILRSAGGSATSGTVADAAGIELNAAVNRLRGVTQKGYAVRVARPRSEGDVFYDLRVAVDRQLSSPPAERPMQALRLPVELEASVRRLAAIEGKAPGELLLAAWHEFVEGHRDTLAAEYRDAAELMRREDGDGLASFAARDARHRAKRAAPDSDA